MDTTSPRLMRAATRQVRSWLFDSCGWDDFAVRGDDIVIATYPKCGTTWVQRIVGMLVFASADPFAVQDSSPWPDMRLIPTADTASLAAGQTHRRFLKSHLPYDALPVHEGVKFIHVARDGRDAALSLFNHKRNYTASAVERMERVVIADAKFATLPRFVPADPAIHFRDWLAGEEDAMGDDGASWFAIEPSFWAARHDPAVLLVHYDDLKTDRDGEMRRIADFLGIAIDEQLWPQLVEAASFAAMKASADALMPGAGRSWEGGARTFLHKGTNGRWRDLYHPDDLADYDRKVAAEFTPALAAWAEKGRLATVDPRAADD